MKKILALVLACVMLASMFTVNAFAANIFGSANDKTSVPAAGDQQNNTGNVNVTVSTITHHYSVDLDYTDATYTLPTLVWNVTTLKYDATGENLDGNFTLVVTNYSDLGVTAKVEVEDSDANDFLSVSLDETTLSVAAVTVSGYDQQGLATKATFTGSLDQADDTTAILKAVTYYAEGDGKANVTDSKATVATYTVTIS